MNKEILGQAQIDIENSRTQSVKSIIVPILEYNEDESFIFELSQLSEEDLLILTEAVDVNLKYTDIELFFVSMENGLFNYGDDYEYKIKDNKLIGTYIFNQKLKGGKR